MKHEPRIRYASILATLLLASCGGLQYTSQVQDDIYDPPGRYPVVAESPSVDPSTMEIVEDDYFDQGEANAAADGRSYYDLTYNDPYYYNYGRFGFAPNVGWGGSMGMGMGMGMGMMPGMSMSLGWSSGWGAPGWGMGMGWGSPAWGMGMGWGSPWAYGGMGWYDPWMAGNMGWGYPGTMSPWGWGSPYWGHPGYGNYWGPWGQCFSCYAPIIIGGASNPVVYGHRPSLSGGGGTGGSPTPGGGNSRIALRDPVGLTPQSRPISTSRPSQTRPSAIERPVQQQRTPARVNPSPAPTPERARSPQRIERTSPPQATPERQRTSPSRPGGMDNSRNFGGSPGNMGGTRSPGTVRPR